MLRKITATILIITISNLVLYTNTLYADDIITPNCAFPPNGTEMTMFGDSRAWNLAVGGLGPASTTPEVP